MIVKQATEAAIAALGIDPAFMLGLLYDGMGRPTRHGIAIEGAIVDALEAFKVACESQRDDFAESDPDPAVIAHYQAEIDRAEALIADCRPF